MSEQPADPVATEDGMYVAIVSEIKGLRRAGASLIEACALTAFYRVAVTQASPPDSAPAAS